MNSSLFHKASERRPATDSLRTRQIIPIKFPIKLQFLPEKYPERVVKLRYANASRHGYAFAQKY